MISKGGICQHFKCLYIFRNVVQHSTPLKKDLVKLLRQGFGADFPGNPRPSPNRGDGHHHPWKPRCMSADNSNFDIADLQLGSTFSTEEMGRGWANLQDAATNR